LTVAGAFEEGKRMAIAANGRVGIIANPVSGKDIRRLVAHASTFDNNEKINIVRRALLALDSLGIGEVWYLPDSYAIVERAAATAELALDLQPLPMEVIGNASDSYEAACRLVDLGAGAIITLGGDGTNRVVAKGCEEVPLVAVSTGTNNVFPRMVEGTLAGLAAGLAALGVADEAIARRPRLDILINDEPRDIALIDVVTSPQQWIGARAVWEPGHIREVVLSRIMSGEIGICGIGGMLFPDAAGSSFGAHIVVGGEGTSVMAPLAPGIVHEVPIAGAAKVLPGESVRLQSAPGTIALDGEREIELLTDQDEIIVTLNPHGPFVVDIPGAINQGALAGVFTRS
jgi:predicted polyphosphate/ATP-dependent NAD kinase